MRSKNTEYYGLIENYINEYYSEHACPPEGREIAQALGMSRPTVTRYLADMAQAGTITYDKYRRPVTVKADGMSAGGAFIPVVGQIACGSPNFAEQDIEDYVRLPESLTGKGDFFFLRAKGNSMIEAGINPGDLVLIRKQNYADSGKIAAVLVDGNEATLKRYYPEREKGRVRLHPENAEMEDMYYEDCYVMGVAVLVIKELE